MLWPVEHLIKVVLVIAIVASFRLCVLVCVYICVGTCLHTGKTRVPWISFLRGHII